MALRNLFLGCDLNRTHPRINFLKAKSRNFWYRARYTKIEKKKIFFQLLVPLRYARLPCQVALGWQIIKSPIL